MTFQAWMSEVNDLCLVSYAISVYDLPDMPFHDAFDAGQAPEEFLGDAIPDLRALAELVLG